jgi:uncharacterized membrane protein YdbT with pleckstrin-like domain
MKIYPTDFDTWILVLLVSGLFVFLVLGFLEMETSLALGWAILGGVAVVFVLILVFLVPCEYYLEEHHMMIRSGLFSRTIAYNDISSVNRIFSISAAPAWSLNRVQINCGDKAVQVSPRDREDFIREIEERITSLEISSR